MWLSIQTHQRKIIERRNLQFLLLWTLDYHCVFSFQNWFLYEKIMCFSAFFFVVWWIFTTKSMKFTIQRRIHAWKGLTKNEVQIIMCRIFQVDHEIEFHVTVTENFFSMCIWYKFVVASIENVYCFRKRDENVSIIYTYIAISKEDLSFNWVR